MPHELYSVEQVADQLGLHVRTIRKYIRDGRLQAVRIGKQYRIAREDLEAFTGGPLVGSGPVAGQVRRAEVSSIVQLDGIDRATADRIGTLVSSSVQSPLDESLRVQIIYSESSAGLKVIVVGDLNAAADLLRVIAALAAES